MKPLNTVRPIKQIPRGIQINVDLWRALEEIAKDHKVFSVRQFILMVLCGVHRDMVKVDIKAINAQLISEGWWKGVSWLP